MNKILEKIANIGIVPVIKIDDVSKAVPLAKALLAGGIPCAEVTFRTKEGEEAIRRIAKEVPEILLGAGTVLSREQVDRAINAGASFIVSPGLNPEVVSYCVEKGITVTPGCANPSDIELALSLGLDTVKFFPAEQAGGLEYIKAVSAPYTTMKFMPTGGINAANINKYLAFDKVIACGGSWMVKADLINDGKFDEITELCRAAVSSVLGFELMHVGVNSENEAEALRCAEMFGAMFGFPVKNGNSSVFAGKYIEFMKKPYLGKNGHIAIGTSSVSRARAYLELKGFRFLEDTEKRDANGKTIAIYIEDEIAGFAVHLLKK